MQFLVTVSGVDGEIRPDYVLEALEMHAAGLIDSVNASQVTVELMEGD